MPQPAREAWAEEALDNSPVVVFVHTLINRAIALRASDIHLEPEDDRYRVRLRIDGMLHAFEASPPATRERVASRIKVLARMDIAERRLPQDGRIPWTAAEGRPLSLRVSSLPTLLGEKLVLRVLDAGLVPLALDQLGHEATDLARLEAALRRPHGMLLMTGPTGSGKTQSLYACLHRLNAPEVNIATVEDPCEIRLPGIHQVNVNDKPGLGFAQVLRALMRQDPDILMVGEIRDLDTAQVAVAAAQTGHLVLSTLHTPDAPGALMRLVHMGIPAYNLAGTLELVIAQRLVRLLCPHCRVPDAAGARGPGLPARSPQGPGPCRPVGCAHCQQGYRGRTGIFQVMPLSETLQDLLLAGAGLQALREQARREGVTTLRQAGLLKVAQGLTSMEEILACTSDDT